MAVFGHIIFETPYFNASLRFYMAENGHIMGVKSEYRRFFTVFGGGFAVILPVFSCEMGVKIFYMPLFKPKRGGLELGRGSSKSNRISCQEYGNQY